MMKFHESDERAKLQRQRTNVAPWHRDSVTQGDIELRNKRQMQTLAIYGIGGCSVKQLDLTEEQSDAWLRLAKRENMTDVEMQWISGVINGMIPLAFKNAITNKKDCRKYFLGKHNKRVKRVKTTESAKRLCLARIGEVKEIRDRNEIKPSLLTNTILLRSKIGKKLQKVASITYEDGTEGYAFVDLEPSIRIGSRVIVHREVVCEMLEE